MVSHDSKDVLSTLVLFVLTRSVRSYVKKSPTVASTPATFTWEIGKKYSTVAQYIHSEETQTECQVLQDFVVVRQILQRWPIYGHLRSFADIYGFHLRKTSSCTTYLLPP